MENSYRQILLYNRSAEGVVDVAKLYHELLIPGREALGSRIGWVYNQRPGNTVRVLGINWDSVRTGRNSEIEGPTYNLTMSLNRCQISVPVAVQYQ